MDYLRNDPLGYSMDRDSEEDKDDTDELTTDDDKFDDADMESEDEGGEEDL